MSAKEFLESKGIEMQCVSLIVFIDNAMRQPDLCLLLEEYAEYKLTEKAKTEDEK